MEPPHLSGQSDAMTEDITHLVRQAEAAANAGQWAAAEKLWSDVRRRDPRNPKAAFGLGVHAMQRRDFSTAAALIEEAQRASPHDPFMLLTLSRAKRDAGDEAGEGAAIERALAIDPYFLPALLAKAQRLERIGNASAAAMFFRNAIKVAGAEVMWPEVLRAQLVHARNTAERHARDHHAQLDEALAPMLSSLPRAQAERWREAASVMAGLTEPYHQHANQLHVPRLPAIPFYERSKFPWAAELESKTAVIREEMKAALADGRQDFQPYIKLRPGQPVDQWRELNQSTRWSHYGLWRNGQPNDDHLAKCPETRRALEMIDMAEIAGLCPNAMFSALSPHTGIPPHTGETNARLVAHLPLVVPEKCTYRVGFEHRTWKEGELLVFDDTIEHTARNNSDELRIILIFDVWNPLLAAEERDVVRALASATRAFNAAH